MKLEVAPWGGACAVKERSSAGDVPPQNTWPMMSKPDAMAGAVGLKLQHEKQLKSLLDEFKALSENWDGYGGLPPTPEAIAIAEGLLVQLRQIPGLESPDLAPQSNGTLSFTWEYGDREAFLEIGRTRFGGYLSSPEYPPKTFSGETHVLNYVILDEISRHLLRASTSNLATTPAVVVAF